MRRLAFALVLLGAAVAGAAVAVAGATGYALAKAILEDDEW